MYEYNAHWSTDTAMIGDDVKPMPSEGALIQTSQECAWIATKSKPPHAETARGIGALLEWLGIAGRMVSVYR
jgi:hypothetical protein